MKGQTALEYLITYGWAILVILVVLAVLWYYGVFNPAKWSGESVSEGSAIKVIDKQLIGSDLKLILGDKTGSQLTLTQIDVAGDVSTTTPWTAGAVIPAGGNSTTLTIPLGAAASSGSFYKFTVTTTYSATGGIADQKDTAQYNIKAV